MKDRRTQFYLYVPDGTSAADFVLIKLQKNSDRREFQVGSFGRVGGGKSGVKRDTEIPYTAEHLAIRTYKIALASGLKLSECAFFMGTGNHANMSDGRVYDFTIAE